MVENQVIPIDFGQGVDSKTDPKLVVPGKMLRLENGVFTNIKRVAKRNGYSALSTTVSDGIALQGPDLVHAYNDELIAGDGDRLLSYSTSESAWIDKGDYQSIELSKGSIDQDIPASGYGDAAILNNYAVYCYSSQYQTNSDLTPEYAEAYGSLVDLSTGVEIIPATLLSTMSANNPQKTKCVLLGGTTLAVTYLAADGLSVIMRRVTFTSPGIASFSAETTVTTGNLERPEYDIAATATGAAILYANGSTRVTLVDTSGVITSSANITDPTDAGVGHINVDATNGNIWCYWFSTNATTSFAELSYGILSSALATVLAKTNIDTGTLASQFGNVIATSLTTTTQAVHYSWMMPLSTDVATDQTMVTRYANVDSTGTAPSPTVFSYGVSPYSRSFRVGALNYAVFAYIGSDILGLNPATASNVTAQQQPTYFILQIYPHAVETIPIVVGRFGAGLANNFAVYFGKYTVNCPAISATKFLLTCGLQLQDFRTDIFQVPGQGFGSLCGEFFYQIDFGSNDTYIATTCGGIEVFNGGLLQMYDGQAVTELGFHLYPEIVLEAVTTTGGAVPAGSHSYIAIYQWTDGQGNLHQSAPSLAQTINVADFPGTDSVNIAISTAYLSTKPGISVAVYRTEAAGTVYYQVNDPVFSTSVDPTLGASVYITDLLSDGDLAGNPQPYTYPASAVLENSTPPPSTLMLSHNNRLWFVDAENPNTIWYTKSTQSGVGLSPSAFLTQQLDPKFGNIAALAEMDEKLITFKDNGIFVQSGDGAADTGTGSTLSFPQFVPSDVGCLYPKSVVGTPTGVMFQSAKGIYMLGRALNVVYIGAEVQQYNSQVITSAILVPGKSQIRFLVNSGTTIVYDYIFNQWSTFTAHTGLSATAWQDTYVYATTAGSVFRESSSLYADNGTGYALLAQTSWLALATVQGFQRVRRLIMLGDYANGSSGSTHGLQIQAAYDFSTSFSTAQTYTFGAVSTSGVYQYRDRLPQQKCDTISLLIQEINVTDTASYIDLTNISFEAGIKKGVNKLAQGQSVG